MDEDSGDNNSIKSTSGSLNSSGEIVERTLEKRERSMEDLREVLDKNKQARIQQREIHQISPEVEGDNLNKAINRSKQLLSFQNLNFWRDCLTTY